MSKIKDLFLKYKEIIVYLVFGVLTTLVNFVAYFLFGLVISEELYLVTNIIAWAIAVAFAYVTNKLFVFTSKSFAPRVLVREIPEFVGARVFSLGVEELGLWLLVDICGLSGVSFTLLGLTFTGSFIAKVILAVVVIIMNYFFSKFIIFKKKEEKE